MDRNWTNAVPSISSVLKCVKVASELTVQHVTASGIWAQPKHLEVSEYSNGKCEGEQVLWNDGSLTCTKFEFLELKKIELSKYLHVQRVSSCWLRGHRTANFLLHAWPLRAGKRTLSSNRQSLGRKITYQQPEMSSMYLTYWIYLNHCDMSWTLSVKSYQRIWRANRSEAPSVTR